MTQNEPKEEEVTKGNRKASIIGMLLLGVGAVLLGFGRVVLPDLGFATSMWFIIFALLVMSSGAVLWLKYGHSQTEARRRATNAIIKGFLVFVVFFVLAILIIIYVVIELPMEQRGLPFLFSIGLMFGGGIIVMAFGVKGAMAAERVPSAAINSFRQIEVDKTFETEKFTVFRKGDVHILVPNRFAGAYFVRLFSQAPAPWEKKTRLPWLFTRFTYKDEISGLSVAKRRGEFTIPVDTVRRGDRTEEKYARGSGVLYYVSRYDVKHYRGRGIPPDLSSKFDTTAIIKIMEELSKENRQTGRTS